MSNIHPLGFELSVSGRNDGTIEAVYIQIFDEPVHHSTEIQEDILIVDYAADGRVVGIEILAPVRLNDLKPLIQHDQALHDSFGKFIQRSAPCGFVTA